MGTSSPSSCGIANRVGLAEAVETFPDDVVLTYSVPHARAFVDALVPLLLVRRDLGFLPIQLHGIRCTVAVIVEDIAFVAVDADDAEGALTPEHPPPEIHGGILLSTEVHHEARAVRLVVGVVVRHVHRAAAAKDDGQEGDGENDAFDSVHKLTFLEIAFSGLVEVLGEEPEVGHHAVPENHERVNMEVDLVFGQVSRELGAEVEPAVLVEDGVMCVAHR